MLARVRSVAHVGLKSVPVEVEVDVATKGFPSFNIVGLPSKAVEEAKERIRTAINNTGLGFPDKKITVNLAPADLVKSGSCYDLPMAVGILAAGGEIEWGEEQERNLYYGELSLDGSLRHTRGVLLVSIFAQKEGFGDIFVPKQTAREAAVVGGIGVRPVESLSQLMAHLRRERLIKAQPRVSDDIEVDIDTDFDLVQVLGQEQAKRALTITAAGGHNLLMSGPPGSGKTMLARCLPSILPPLTSEEALEVTQIYSATGLLKAGEALVRVRPFRSPHHSTSLAGLVGGGSNPLPGEVSLGHLGVMFLDEMAEFPRSVLEAMRQPMEDGRVVISRAAGRVEYPADFMLVAAVNPCPCGYLNHPRKECRCSLREVARYRRRISGPILDRIDLHVNVPAVETRKLTQDRELRGQSSGEVRQIVISARNRQLSRFAGRQVYNNAQMRNKLVDEVVSLDGESRRLLELAVDKYDLSARAYYRLLKVARTIADLAGEERVAAAHLAEALQYRMRVF